MAEEDVRQPTNAMLDIISVLVHESEPVNDQGAGMDSLQYAMVIFFVVMFCTILVNVAGMLILQ